MAFEAAIVTFLQRWVEIIVLGLVAIIVWFTQKMIKDVEKGVEKAHGRIDVTRETYATKSEVTEAVNSVRNDLNKNYEHLAGSIQQMSQANKELIEKQFILLDRQSGRIDDVHNLIVQELMTRRQEREAARYIAPVKLDEKS